MRGDEPILKRNTFLAQAAEFPACAGMNRVRPDESREGMACRVPRMRGDEPSDEKHVWTLMSEGGVPRMRGDEPAIYRELMSNVGCQEFPACAGMNRCRLESVTGSAEPEFPACAEMNRIG